MSSNSSSTTNELLHAPDAGIIAATTHPRGRRRSLVPLLASIFATSLPAALTPKAREAAAAAIKLTRTADAVRAARGVVQRVPARAKLAIRDAVDARNHARDERVRARRQLIADRYALPLADRIPALLKQREAADARRCWDWMAEMCEADEAEEKAAAQKAAAAKG